MDIINFISLQVKCPVCNKSLMDDDYKIDNESSIKLFVESAGKTGTLRMSSIYGSYNYLADVDLPANELTKFFCPHCRELLLSNDNCNTCEAPMVSLNLDIGGKISFCSRKGCTDHNIGFEDLSVALKKLYQDYEYSPKHKIKQEDVFMHDKKEKEKSDAEITKEIIETGSFLQIYCPHCKKTLIEDAMFKLRIINEKNEMGYLMLSPYLNVFSSKSTIYLPEEKELNDIRCFQCDASLKVPERKCDKCGTTIAKVMVSAHTKMIDFYICARKGCIWHGLSENDLEDIRLEDSVEW
ncbi:MAG: hypothetical protein WCH34_03585 [Bacteroidota bacterium]